MNGILKWQGLYEERFCEGNSGNALLNFHNFLYVKQARLFNNRACLII